MPRMATIAPSHSPSNCAFKRPKLHHQVLSEDVTHRPVKQLPHAHHVQPGPHLKRKLPGDPSELGRAGPSTTPFYSQQSTVFPVAGPSKPSHLYAQPPQPQGVSPAAVIPFADPRAVSVPPATYPQPMYQHQSPMYPPHPQQQVGPGMYPNSGYGHMGNHWPQQHHPVQWPPQPMMQNMSPEQYAEWYKSQS